MSDLDRDFLETRSRFMVALRRLRARKGRDYIRSLRQGKLLDALDAGRPDTSHDLAPLTAPDFEHPLADRNGDVLPRQVVIDALMAAKPRCPHDGALCHHRCLDNTFARPAWKGLCMRKRLNMSLANPRVGFPVEGDTPVSLPSASCPAPKCKRDSCRTTMLRVKSGFACPMCYDIREEDIVDAP